MINNNCIISNGFIFLRWCSTDFINYYKILYYYFRTRITSIFTAHVDVLERSTYQLGDFTNRAKVPRLIMQEKKERSTSV